MLHKLPTRYLNQLPPCDFCLRELIADSRRMFGIPDVPMPFCGCGHDLIAHRSGIACMFCSCLRFPAARHAHEPSAIEETGSSRLGPLITVENPPLARYSGPNRWSVGPGRPRVAAMCEEHFTEHGQPSLCYRLEHTPTRSAILTSNGTVSTAKRIR